METEDFALCGYLKKGQYVSFILGQYDGDKLLYKGHITLGASLKKLNDYKYNIISESPFGYVPKGNENAVWLEPKLTCIIEFMPSENINYRQAICKWIRDDKLAIDCKISK